MPKRIFKVLDLCTNNLPKTLADQMPAVPGVIAYEHGRYGWFMWVPPTTELQSDEVPPEIARIYEYARHHACDYVLFDRDAATEPDLPWWEW